MSRNKKRKLDGAVMSLELLVPAKTFEQLTPAELKAEIDAVQAGQCLQMPKLGHVHIAAPVDSDQATVPVYKFVGRDHSGIARYEMATADPAMLLALAAKEKT